MKKKYISFLLCLVFVVSLFAGIPFGNNLGTSAEAANDKWISTWHGSMLDLNAGRIEDSAYGTAIALSTALWSDATYRINTPITVGGKNFKVTLTNYYGSGDITVKQMSVGLKGSGAMNSMDTSSEVYVNSGNSFTIPKGGSRTLSFSMRKTVPSGANLILNICLNYRNFRDVKDAALIGGTAWAVRGNCIGDDTLSAVSSLKKLTQEDANTGNYEIIPMVSNISVETSDDAYTTVVVGDSTVTNSIPSMLYSKLTSNGVGNVAVVSSGIKGNELLKDGQNSEEGPLEGKALVTRFALDGLDSGGVLQGVGKVFVKIGINDLIHPNCTNLSQYYDGMPSYEQIIDGFTRLISAAHNEGVEIYFAELTPWYGYTREGTVTTDPTKLAAIESLRVRINEWLANNNNMGDKVYDPYRDNHGIGTGGFGFVQALNDDLMGVPVSEAGNSYYQLKDSSNNPDADFTTDFIHFTTAGQKQVAKSIPIGIFIDRSENEDENKAEIHNLYLAQTSTNEGTDYLIASSAGSSASSDQETRVYLCGDDNVEEQGRIVAHWYGPVPTAVWKVECSMKETAETMQRGTQGVPYIAIGTSKLNPENNTGDYLDSYWNYSGSQTAHYWQNKKSNRYLSWYYNSGTAVQSEFDTDARAEQPLYKAFEDGFPEGNYYTFGTTPNYSNEANHPYLFEILYGSVGGALYGDKYLTFGEQQNSEGDTGNHFRTYNSNQVSFDYANRGLALLASRDNVKTSLTATSNKEQVYYCEPEGTEIAPVAFALSDDLTSAIDTYKDTFSSNSNGSNMPTNAGYKFKSYTYGNADNRSFTVESSNPSVATANGTEVTLAGGYGTAELKWTFTWKELDGTEYHMTETTTVTNVGYECDIEMPSGSDEYPDEYSFEADADPRSINVTAIQTNSIPEGQNLRNDGEWVWESSNSNAVSVSGSGANATITGSNSTEGIATITATYKQSNGDKIYCSSSVTVENHLAAIDILVGGPTGTSMDSYVLVNAEIDDTLSLFAETVQGSLPDGGTWAWTSSDEEVLEATGDTADGTVTVKGYGSSTVVATYTYEVDGVSFMVYDSIIIHVKKTTPKTVVVGYSAKNVIDNNVYEYEKENVIENGGKFNLENAPGTLTFTPEWVKADDSYSYNMTALSSVSTANYYKNAVKTSADTECYRVTVVPANSVYFDDDLKDETILVPNGDAVTENVEYKNAQLMSNDDATVSMFFTFKGTGIDVYSTTDQDTKNIQMAIYHASSPAECIYDNIAKPAKVMRGLSNDTRVNVPTVHFMMDEYGTYTLKINVLKGSNWKWDGVRVYNTLENSDPYPADEKNAVYINLRDALINNNDKCEVDTSDINRVQDLTEFIEGVLFIDDKAGLVTTWINDNGEEKPRYNNTFDAYKKDGPKNEIYLTTNQKLVFQILNWPSIKRDNPNVKVMVGLSVPNTKDTQANVVLCQENKVISSKIDQYYVLTPDANGNVQIENNGPGMLSVTNLKISGFVDEINAEPGTIGNTIDSNSVAPSRSLRLGVNARTILYAAGDLDEPNGDEENTGNTTGNEPQDPGNGENDDPEITDNPDLPNNPDEPSDPVIVPPEDDTDDSAEQDKPSDTGSSKVSIAQTIKNIISSITKTLSNLFKSIFSRR